MLSRCSYTILDILHSQNATDKIHGMTIVEISKFENNVRYNTLYKKILQLQSLGYVKEGLQDGKSKSYYITEQGLNELPDK